MPDSTRESDRILREAKTSLVVQREGGTHRPALRGASIGKASADLKLKSLLTKVRNIALAIFAIWLGAGIAGAFIGGIGFWGVMAVVVATAIAVAVFSSFPKVKVPRRAELKQGNPGQMVARTELWLEAQRPALPPPAQALVDQLGEGAIMVLPVGPHNGPQRLVRVTKGADGSVNHEELIAVRFVPLLPGKAQEL